jgi:dihydroorotase
LPGGRLAGSDADLTIFDPEESAEIDPRSFRSRARNTPFAGAKVTGVVVATVVGGREVYRRP